MQSGVKRVTIWLQQGNRNLLSVKSFSSCFKRYRARVLLLRLFSFTVVFHVPHRRYLASCAKKPVRDPDGLFCVVCSPAQVRQTAGAAGYSGFGGESMTHAIFGGHFDCFSRADICKVWRSRGLYSCGLCGKVYTINFGDSNMNDFVVERLNRIKRKGV